MRRRQLQAQLTTVAGLLLLLQIGLYGIVATTSPPPEALPPLGAVAPNHNSALPLLPAVSSERVAVQVLDRLLDQRLRSAAARENVDIQSLVPPSALREAALASPAPDGPAVRALIAHYGASLKTLGETLDATSGD